MAAKGTEAKEIVTKDILAYFAEKGNSAGVVDKKIYINVRESSGEMVQVALALTCPKNPVDIGEMGNTELDDNQAFSLSDGKIELTEEEQRRIAELKEKLGL